MGGRKQVIFSQEAPGTRAKLMGPGSVSTSRNPNAASTRFVTSEAVQVDDFYGEPPGFDRSMGLEP